MGCRGRYGIEMRLAVRMYGHVSVCETVCLGFDVGGGEYRSRNGAKVISLGQKHVEWTYCPAEIYR